MAELSYLTTHLQAMIDGLSDGQMLRLKKTLAQKVRLNQKKRISAQQNADGSPYTPRRPQRQQKGRRVRAKMMNTIKNARHMKIEQNKEGFTIGYVGRMATIASVHQYGLTARVNDAGATAAYPVRELLGVSDADKALIEEVLFDYLNGIV